MHRLLRAFVAAVVGAAIASALVLVGKAILDFADPPPRGLGGDQLQHMVGGVGEAIEICALLFISSASGVAIGATLELPSGSNADNRHSRWLRLALLAYWALLMLVLDAMDGQHRVASLWGSTVLAIAGLWVAWCGWNARLAIGNANAVVGVVAGLAMIPTGVVCITMQRWLRGPPNRGGGVFTALSIFCVLLMSLVLWLLVATKAKRTRASGKDVA